MADVESHCVNASFAVGLPARGGSAPVAGRTAVAPRRFPAIDFWLEPAAAANDDRSADRAAGQGEPPRRR